jgi:hypothetical protein
MKYFSTLLSNINFSYLQKKPGTLSGKGPGMCPGINIPPGLGVRGCTRNVKEEIKYSLEPPV